MKRLAQALVENLSLDPTNFDSSSLVEIAVITLKLSKKFFQNDDEKYGTEKSIVRTFAVLCMTSDEKLFLINHEVRSLLLQSLKQTFTNFSACKSLDSSSFCKALQVLSKLYVSATNTEITDMISTPKVLQSAIAALSNMVNKEIINIAVDKKILDELLTGKLVTHQGIYDIFVYSALGVDFSPYVYEYFALSTYFINKETSFINLADDLDKSRTISVSWSHSPRTLITEIVKAYELWLNCTKDYIFFSESLTRKTSFRVWRRECLRRLEKFSVLELLRVGQNTESELKNLKRSDLRNQQRGLFNVLNVSPKIPDFDYKGIGISREWDEISFDRDPETVFSVSCTLFCKEENFLSDKYIPRFFKLDGVQIESKMALEFKAKILVVGKLQSRDFKQAIVLKWDKSDWKLELETVNANTMLIIGCAAALMAEMGFQSFSEYTEVIVQAPSKDWKYLFALGFAKAKEESFLLLNLRQIEKAAASNESFYKERAQTIELHCSFENFVLFHTSVFPVWFYE